ncbi:MAG: sulfatase [Planctomycetota bacterium]|nr:sulfatase [Planctomycetota bacterium]MDA1143206.1 sulfatase [Planctomycetota bacterium]
MRSLLIALLAVSIVSSLPAETLPNVVVIFIDDMGYADIGPFGAESYSTPHLDLMAKEGMKFTDFQVSSAVCSASRAALLTGCYHRRVGISGALGPKSPIGLSAVEMTIAELCKQKGYATACFGKWHLGSHEKFLPLQHGFDEYLGLPYSNDMWPYHSRFANLPLDDPKRRMAYPDLPLFDGNRIIDDNVTAEDQEQLTTKYTERAVDFINRNKNNPFFLYVPHSMVHVPLYVSDKFKGKSERGLFGDVVMEVDWSVGQILGALKTNGIDEKTLVIFTSDNGPWLNYGDHAGSAKPLREGKGTMFEGGCRVPTVMRWPGRIPAGKSCKELASTIDILPTVAKLIGANLPGHKIDGKDFRPLMFGEQDAQSPHEVFYHYYGGGQLQAVRDRRWKLHFPHSYRTLDGRKGGTGGQPVSYSEGKIGKELFDLESDASESMNVIERHPEIVERLEKYAEAARDDLGDSLSKRPGKGIRPPGRLEPGDKRTF